jgi:hypothetical protein
VVSFFLLNSIRKGENIMPQLHETMYGKKLLEGDIPQIIRSLKKISGELEYANELKEKELKLKNIELELKERELEHKNSFVTV